MLVDSVVDNGTVVGVAALTIKLKDLLPVFAVGVVVSVTVTVTVAPGLGAVPVGVPLINPVPDAILNPVGRPVAL